MLLLCIVSHRAANVMSSSRTNEAKTMNYFSDSFSLISPNCFFFPFRNLLIFPLKPIPISLNSMFLVRACLAVKAVKYLEVFFVYGCINVRIKFGNCYWTNLLSIIDQHEKMWVYIKCFGAASLIQFSMVKRIHISKVCSLLILRSFFVRYFTIWL